ncbi:MAG: ABC-type transport auxiliary lipoprotein family protein [Deltaproteobacteria bacterium]|jgi:ABC-type uncharacterized transport system auxiliary subunit|nr:ABC-type transport auxiliary lipoprotein family protein [Deltaproteobacteria bacterium]
MSRATPFLCCWLLLAGLAGCAVLDPGPPMVRVMLPVELPVADKAEPLPAQVLVALPVADAAVDTDRIMALMHGYELRALDAAKWASPAPVMLQRLLVDSLDASRRFAGVGREESGLDAAIRLTADIRRFYLRYGEAAGAPVAEFSMALALVDSRSDTVFKRTAVSVEQACAGNSLKDFVAAFSVVVSKGLLLSREWVEKGVAEHLAAQK